MSLVKSKNTAPELTLRRLLHRAGYRYRLHVSSLPGRPDLVFPARKKVIFVSGCFWHMHDCGRCRIPQSNRPYWLAKLRRNRDRDLQHRNDLRRLGWGSLTVWECELSNLSVTARRVARFLR